MIFFRSNLSAPDLVPYFKIAQFEHNCGHTYFGDPDFEPRCGFFTADEAAILYNVAKSINGGGWLDIGARTGWTAAHIIAAGGYAVAIEPEYYREDFRDRAIANISAVRAKFCPPNIAAFFPWPMRAEEYFAARRELTSVSSFDGVVIDGNHDSPEPLNDAMSAARMCKRDCIFVIHDFLGPATWDAAEWLMTWGCKCRVYWTPNVMAVCWRGEWKPPDHVPDPQCVLAYRGPVGLHFNLNRCS